VDFNCELDLSTATAADQKRAEKRRKGELTTAPSSIALGVEKKKRGGRKTTPPPLGENPGDRIKKKGEAESAGHRIRSSRTKKKTPATSRPRASRSLGRKQKKDQLMERKRKINAALFLSDKKEKRKKKKEHLWLDRGTRKDTEEEKRQRRVI